MARRRTSTRFEPRARIKTDASVAPHEPVLAQLMIQHPNSSGLAKDQMTQLFIPAYFVRTVEVTYADRPIMTAEVDFTISENPNFRFYFVPKEAGELKATVSRHQGPHVRDQRSRGAGDARALGDSPVVPAQAGTQAAGSGSGSSPAQGRCNRTNRRSRAQPQSPRTTAQAASPAQSDTAVQLRFRSVAYSALPQDPAREDRASPPGGQKRMSAAKSAIQRRILCACLALWSAMPYGRLQADEDYREAQRLRQSGKILPLETIVQRAKAVHPGKLLDIELEHDDGRYVYELELLDERGVVWELKYDAATGTLLKQKREK